MDNAIDNKPIFCAFCGSLSVGDCSDRQSDGKPFYFVGCDSCEAMGPTAHDRDEARRLWNHRMAEPREPNGGHSPYDEWRTGADV